MKTLYYMAIIQENRLKNDRANVTFGYKVNVNFLTYKNGKLLKLCRKQFSWGRVMLLFKSKIARKDMVSLGLCPRLRMTIENCLATGALEGYRV